MLCLHSLADGVCCQTFGFFFSLQYSNPVLSSLALLGKAEKFLTGIHGIDLIRR